MSRFSPQLELTIAGHEHSSLVLVLGSDVDAFPNDVAFQLHDALAPLAAVHSANVHDTAALHGNDHRGDAPAWMVAATSCPPSMM